jgi:hypothetical protein
MEGWSLFCYKWDSISYLMLYYLLLYDYYFRRYTLSKCDMFLLHPCSRCYPLPSAGKDIVLRQKLTLLNYFWFTRRRCKDRVFEWQYEGVWWTEKDVEGNSRGLIQGIIPVFWRHWVNSLRPWVRIVGILGEIRNEGFPKTSQKRYLLRNLTGDIAERVKLQQTEDSGRAQLL